MSHVLVSMLVKEQPPGVFKFHFRKRWESIYNHLEIYFEINASVSMLYEKEHQV